MVTKEFVVPLDIKRPTASNRDFEVVEGDTGNVIVVTLTDNGAAVDLTGCLVVAAFSKPDGTTVEQDTEDHGIEISGDEYNVVTISLYTGSFSPGMVNCELQVYSGEDNAILITSAQFNFSCRRAVVNGDTVKSTEQYPILTALISGATAAIGDAESAASSAAVAASLANGKAVLAETAAGNANAKAGFAEQKAALADQKAALADQKAIAANTAAGNATEKAALAQTAAADANTAAAAANAAAAQVLTNGQADWSQTDAAKVDYIRHKPVTMPPSAHTHAPSEVGAIPATEKGVASGVATLDANGKVAAEQASASLTYAQSVLDVSLEHSGKFIWLNNTSALTVTIPTNDSIAFPIGTEIEICRWNTGTITIVPATDDVDIRSINDARAIADRYGCACLKKIGVNVWLLAGALG